MPGGGGQPALRHFSELVYVVDMVDAVAFFTRAAMSPYPHSV